MSSLTETAFYTRRTVNWLILGIIFYILLRVFWSIFVAIWLVVFPPQPPPPTNAFGKLPTIKFPSPTASPSGQLTFRLETISGGVPVASDSANVYFMPKNPANLLALNKAQTLAGRFDLDPTPIQESKNVYRFVDAKFPLRKLRYDIVSNNFILRYSFEFDAGLFSERNLPTNESVLSESRSFLQTYGLYKEDFAKGKNVITYLKLVGNHLDKTTSLSQADALRLDFFRKDVFGTRIFTPYPDEAPISIIYSGNRNQAKKILQFTYTYWPIDYQTSATYALKASSIAWQELQNGSGYIARYPARGNEAVIRNVYLGYYDSDEPQMYLQPIFIFEGDNDFIAYVTAVDPAWIE